MKKISIASCLILTLASPLTMAMELEPHWYIGASYNPLTLEGDDGGAFDVSTATIKLGAGLHKFMAVEARYGTSVKDDTQSMLGVDVTGEVESYYGAYLKGIVPVHPLVSLYGLAGYSHVDAKISSAFGSDSASDDGFSYGAGLSFNVNRNVSINAEWVSLLDKDDYKLTGYGVGVNFMF